MMATWNSRGLRGSSLEDLINMTNEKYRSQKLGLIQKIPTPIKPIQIDHDKHQITLAYFEQRSTVDYIGAVQGIPVCFDAKECQSSTFPIQNIHEHQIVFMEDFERQGGVAFLIIHFTSVNKYYYLRFKKIVEFWNRSKTGRRKSFTIEEMEADFEIPASGIYLHYLTSLQKDLELR